MPDENNKTQAAWELDRKVPLAIILTVVTQFVLGIWYAAKFDTRMSTVETQQLIMQQNYATLNTAREASNMSIQRAQDSIERSNDMLRALLARSNSLHPEMKDMEPKGP